MATFKPETTYTLEDFIRAGRLTSISFDKFSYKELLSNGAEISILNIVDDYLPELKQLICTVRLTDAQYQRYRFKPKLLCYDIYGNPEIYYIILLLNGIIDVKEFDFTTVKMIRKDHMDIILSYIYNAEKSRIDSYNTDHGTY